MITIRGIVTHKYFKAAMFAAVAALVAALIITGVLTERSALALPALGVVSLVAIPLGILWASTGSDTQE